LLRERKTHYHVCATVSPRNVWNIPVLLTNGFYIANLKEKYGGTMRCVVYQDSRKPVYLPPCSLGEIMMSQGVAHDHFKTHDQPVG
jgi:hypothetical protein